jgi:sugar transferase (PEP-CTERM/EpsH1 system associated)
LKILVISHRVPFPPNKGEKLRTYHQLERLSQLGHSLSLIAPRADAEDQQFAHGLSCIFDMRVTTNKLPFKLFRFIKALLSGRSLSEANFYSSGTQRLIEAEIATFQPDYLLLTASSLVKYSDACKTAKHRPIILTDFMDVDSNKWQQYEYKSTFPMNWVYRREAKLIRNLEIEATQISKECYLIAAAEVELFKREIYNTNTVNVLPNGIDSSIFAPAPKILETPALTLLFAGVMDYKPNIDAVFWFVDNCWPSIKTQYPDAKFVIAGMNPSSSVLKLRTDNNIVVTGFVDDIMPYFQSATLFVAPFQIARGVQNKVLQAMSCEIPVVTTARGIEGIIHNDGEDILIADSAIKYAQLCLDLLDSLELRTSIGKAARKTILTHYAWPEVLKPLTNQIENKP